MKILSLLTLLTSVTSFVYAQKIEGEDFDLSCDCTSLVANDSGAARTAVGGMRGDREAWIGFDVDFGCNVQKTLTVRWSKGNTKQTSLDIYLGSKSGTQIGSIDTQAGTGGWWTYTESTIDIPDSEWGPQTLVIAAGDTFNNGHGNIDYIEVSGTPSFCSPTFSPTLIPTLTPTISPTRTPTRKPTEQPTSSPTENLTKSPTNQPTKSPTPAPVANLYFCGTSVSDNESECLYACPSGSSTECPMGMECFYAAGCNISDHFSPTSKPSASTGPTDLPSLSPSLSSRPSAGPSFSPSISIAPTSAPSVVPSSKPSESTSPTNAPSLSPSSSLRPSVTPSFSPSISSGPSSSPSQLSSLAPSFNPSANPSYLPTSRPSSSPSFGPSTSAKPSSAPSYLPSLSKAPTAYPTVNLYYCWENSDDAEPLCQIPCPTGDSADCPMGMVCYASEDCLPSESPSPSVSSVPSASPSEAASVTVTGFNNDDDNK